MNMYKLLEDMLACGIVTKEDAPNFTAEVKRIMKKAGGGSSETQD